MALDNQFVKGADKLQQRIQTIRENLNLPDLTADIGGLLLRRTLERFDAQVDPDGVAWEPLSEETIITKRRKGYPSAALKQTLALRNAIRVIRGGRGTVYTNTGAGVRIGVQDSKVAEYAKVQNNGTSLIPARRFLGIGRLDIKAVDSLLRRRALRLQSEI